MVEYQIAGSGIIGDWKHDCHTRHVDDQFLLETLERAHLVNHWLVRLLSGRMTCFTLAFISSVTGRGCVRTLDSSRWMTGWTEK